MSTGSPTGRRLLVLLPAAVSLAVAVGPSSAATGSASVASSAAGSSGSARFCGESVTLLRDLLGFGKLPKTSAAVVSALARVDREFARVSRDAPSAADRSSITALRSEFARLRSIIVSDPGTTRPADRAFVARFSRTAASQGTRLGGEIRAACR